MTAEYTAADTREIVVSTRLSRGLIAGLRIGVALLWIQNVGWKVPPDFGQGVRPRGLYQFTNYAVEHPVFPPFSWLVTTAKPSAGTGSIIGRSAMRTITSRPACARS